MRLDLAQRPLKTDNSSSWLPPFCSVNTFWKYIDLYTLEKIDRAFCLATILFKGLLHLLHTLLEKRPCHVLLCAELGRVGHVIRPDVSGLNICSLQGAKEDDRILAIIALLQHLSRPCWIASHLYDLIWIEEEKRSTPLQKHRLQLGKLV